MLRLGYVFTAIAVITAVLLPFQWIAGKLGLPSPFGISPWS